MKVLDERTKYDLCSVLYKDMLHTKIISYSESDFYSRCCKINKK